MPDPAREGALTDAEIDELLALHIDDGFGNCDAPCCGTDFDSVPGDYTPYRWPCPIVRLITELSAARAVIRDAADALATAPKLQLAIWYAVHGPDVTPEPTADYRLYVAIRALVVAAKGAGE